jgi:hypothetical protein
MKSSKHGTLTSQTNPRAADSTRERRRKRRRRRTQAAGVPSSPVLYAFSSQFLGINALQVHGEACPLRLPLRPSCAARRRRHAVHRGPRPRRRARHHGAGARRRPKLLQDIHGGIHLPPLPRARPGRARQPGASPFSCPPTTCSSKCSRGSFGAVVAHRRLHFVVFCASRRSCTGRR